MGCCSTKANSLNIKSYKTSIEYNSKKEITSKITRCFITKTFNFDNQNLKDLSVLDKNIHSLVNNESNKKDYAINVLSAKENYISHLPLEFLKYISCLKILILSKNEFDNFPVCLFNLNLNSTIKKIDLSFNNISIIPDNISNIKSLEELNLSNNKITYNGMSLDISNLDKLSIFDMSFNLLDVFPEFLLKNKKLEVLLINNNNISFDKKCYDENTWIHNNSNLNNLDLSYNNIKYLPSFILKHSNVSILNLKGNLITYNDLKEINGYQDFLKRRKDVKDKGFCNNLDINFDICGIN